MLSEHEDGLRLLLKKIWDGYVESPSDIDGGDLHDLFVESGLVELRKVNPDENDWGEDHLYFLKPEVKAWLDPVA